MDGVARQRRNLRRAQLDPSSQIILQAALDSITAALRLATRHEPKTGERNHPTMHSFDIRRERYRAPCGHILAHMPQPRHAPSSERVSQRTAGRSLRGSDTNASRSIARERETEGGSSFPDKRAVPSLTLSAKVENMRRRCAPDARPSACSCANAAGMRGNTRRENSSDP